MLEPRIYRKGLLAVVLAVIVFAFALQGQPGPLRTALAPDAFNGQNAYANTVDLARQFPRRSAGSLADQALAGVIAARFRGYGYAVSSQRFKAATTVGTRRLQNVIAVRPGMTNSAIVVAAHRDAMGSPAVAEQSGTGVLLEIARVLSGETLDHTIVLVSTTGSTGAAGAAHLASTLGRPVDAVLVLGDMAGTDLSRPLVVPWSDGAQLAPTQLRNTAAAALRGQAGLTAGNPSLAAQLVHLAFPLALTEQGPFAAHGLPAVLLSTSGDKPPSPSEPVSSLYQTRLGRAALQTIKALDSSPRVPPPSAYLSLDGKQVPEWAVRLLVLALILPVAATALDGLARARRRRYAVARPIGWVVAASAPFLAALGIVLGTRAAGLLSFAPPGPTGPGAVPLHPGATALLAVLGAVIVASFALLGARGALRALAGSTPKRRRTARSAATRASANGHGAAADGNGHGAAGDGNGRGSAGDGNGHPPARSRRAERSADPGAAAAILISSCAIVLVTWSVNPFAALLLVPALHLWMVAMAPEMHIGRGARAALLTLGFVPPALLITYYAVTLHFGAVSLAWTGVLMVAGGQIGIPEGVLLCLLAGCAVSAAVNVLGTKRSRPPAKRSTTAITVRGPVTYAGPGSLGGTPSALPGTRSPLRR